MKDLSWKRAVFLCYAFAKVQTYLVRFSIIKNPYFIKNILYYISALCILQGCSLEVQNHKLLGNWSQVNGSDEIEFYMDSIVVRESGEHILTDTWTADGNTIYLTPVIESDESAKTSRNFEFKFNQTLDTLYLKRTIDMDFDYTLYKVHNAYDYIFQRNEITLELPFAEGLEPSDKKRLAVNLLLGYRNDTIIFKFQDGKNFNLKTLKSLSFDVFNRLNYKGSAENVQFNLIADKNISVISIDSITKQLHTIGFENVFRVYANDRTDYNKTPWLSPISWYGYYK